MFGGNTHIPDRAPMQSYTAAEAVFNSIPPIRGREPHSRPFGNRRNDNLHIWRDEHTGNIGVRLYRTDVVIWTPDNRLIIDGWASNLTNKLVRDIDPSRSLGFHFPQNSPFFAVERSAKGYDYGEGVTLIRIPHRDAEFELYDGAAAPLFPLEHWRCNLLDRSANRKLLSETRWPEFLTWIKVQERLGLIEKIEYTVYWNRPSVPCNVREHELLDLLERGVSGWSEAVEWFGRNSTGIGALKQRMRDAIYYDVGGPVQKIVDMGPRISWHQYRTYRDSISRYGHAPL